MLRYRLIPAVLLVPFLVILGCGGEKPPDKTDGGGDGTPSKTPQTKEELVSKGWGALQGKVTFDGEPPVAADLKLDKDTDHCKKGPAVDTTEPTWRVGGPDKGVGNVVVWLRAPKGKYFKIPDNAKARTEAVTLEQPFCAFEPHIVALYPSYYDAASKKQKPTGQKLRVVNNAPIPHNTNLSFVDSTINPGGFNRQMPAKKGDTADEVTLEVKASKPADIGGEQSFLAKCDIHPWMNARGRIFDHPFFAVTSGGKKDDKEFGTFKIENAPAGVELELVYWHESMTAPKVLKKITLKDGETLSENIKISK